MSAVDRLYFEVIRQRQQLGRDPKVLPVTKHEHLELAVNFLCPLITHDVARGLLFMEIPVGLTDCLPGVS